MTRVCPTETLDAALDRALRDPDDGLALLADLADQYPDDVKLLSTLGQLHLLHRRSFDAVVTFERAERAKPDAVIQDFLAQAYMMAGMVVHAEDLEKRTGLHAHDEPHESGSKAARDWTHGEGWRDVAHEDLLTHERARAAVQAGHWEALDDLIGLVERNPRWLAAHVMLCASYFVHGDLERYYAAAEAAFRAAPDNAMALVHATRATFLREGSEGARRLRPYLADASTSRSREEDLASKAEAAAWMDDEPAVRSLLDELGEPSAPLSHVDRIIVERLSEALEYRSHDPRIPLARFSMLLEGCVAHWVGEDDEVVYTRAGRDLALAPGFLKELPDRLGYEDVKTASFFGLVLLSDAAPPAPDGMAWEDVILTIANEGPGLPETREDLIEHILGRVSSDEDDPERVTEMVEFEITSEPIPNGLKPADQRRLERALEAFTEGRVNAARQMLGSLANTYPDEPSVVFNLALTEKTMGDSARYLERLERLRDEHPDYLFAKVELAMRAMEEGDIEHAEALLTVPRNRNRMHRQEWAVYSVALGHLALERGDVDGAMRYLASLAEVVGEEYPSYRKLDAAIDQYLDERDVEVDDWDDVDDVDDFDDVDFSPAGSVAYADTPGIEDLLRLPNLGETWRWATAELALPMGQAGDLTRLRIAAVMDEKGLLRRIHMHEGPPSRTSLYADVAEACVTQSVGIVPGRPRTIIVNEPELVSVFQEALEGMGVTISLGDTSEALGAMEEASMTIGTDVPAWIAHAPAQEASAFVRAWDRFFDAYTWEAFPPYERIAFRVGNDPWHYATLMGHGGEEFGIAIFPSWSLVDVFSDPEDDTAPLDRLDANDRLESVSLSEMGLASALDVPFYMDAIGVTNIEDDAPLCLAYTRSGQATPRYGPAVYAALLDLLATRAKRVLNEVRKIDATLETSAGPVRVRYPATGLEQLVEPGGPAGQA